MFKIGDTKNKKGLEFKQKILNEDLYSKIKKVFENREKYLDFLENNPIVKKLGSEKVKLVNSSTSGINFHTIETIRKFLIFSPFSVSSVIPENLVLTSKLELTLRENFIENSLRDVIEEKNLKSLIDFYSNISIYEEKKFQNLQDSVVLKNIKTKIAKRILNLCPKKNDKDVLKALKIFNKYPFDKIEGEFLVKLANNYYEDKKNPCTQDELDILIEICKLILKTGDKTEHQNLILKSLDLKLDEEVLEKMEENGYFFQSKSHIETFFEIFKALNQENLLSKDFFITYDKKIANTDGLIWVIIHEFLSNNLVVEAYEFIKKGCQSSINFDYSQRGNCGLCYMMSMLFLDPDSDYSKNLSERFSVEEDKTYFPFKTFFYLGFLLPMGESKEDIKARLIENLKTEKDIQIILENLKKENFEEVRKNFKDGIELSQKYQKDILKEKIERNEKRISELTESNIFFKEDKVFGYKESIKRNKITILEREKKTRKFSDETEKIIHRLSWEKKDFKRCYFDPLISQLKKQIVSICSSNEGNKKLFLEKLEKLRNTVIKSLEPAKMENFHYLNSLKNITTYF